MNSKVKIIITSLVVLVIVAAVVVGIVLNNNSTEASSENNETDNDIDVNEDMPEENENETNEDENENEDETNSEENEDGVPFGLTKEELEKELEAIENNEQRYVIQEDKENRIRELKILLGEEANTLGPFEKGDLREELTDIVKDRAKFDTEEEKEKRTNEIITLLDVTLDEFIEEVERLDTVDSDDPMGHLNMREKYQYIKDNLTDEDKAFAQEFQNNGHMPKLKEAIQVEVDNWNNYRYSFGLPEGGRSVSADFDTLFVTEFKGSPLNHVKLRSDENSGRFTYFIILNIEFDDGSQEGLLIENLGRFEDDGSIMASFRNAISQTDIEDWFLDTTIEGMQPRNYILTDWIDEEN